MAVSFYFSAPFEACFSPPSAYIPRLQALIHGGHFVVRLPMLIDIPLILIEHFIVVPSRS